MTSSEHHARPVLGLDVGGAHLKAALVEPGGRVAMAVQLPCPLWQGVDVLEAALTTLPLRPDADVAVTMSGELADIFADRARGVTAIVGVLETRLGPALYWAGPTGLLDADAARACSADVGSANWLATATVAASRVSAALVIDIGSTTTDLVVLGGGRVHWRGWGDRDRLAEEELVYCGAARTSLMAVASTVPFQGRRVPLMNEHFATTADVWRLLNLLPKGADQHGTADRGPKTAEASARRLARMVGADLGDATLDDWRRLAVAFAFEQETQLAGAILRQLSHGLIDEAAPFLVTGSGAFIGRRLAARFGRPCIAFSELVDADPQAAASIDTAAPAVAVALLAAASTA